MKLIIIPTIIAAVTLSACAPQPQNVEATYVSPDQYRGKSCASLNSELNVVIDNVNALAAQQKQDALNDVAMMTGAAILFWPAMIVAPLTPDHADDLAAAKGRYDAITTRMDKAGCS